MNETCAQCGKELIDYINVEFAPPVDTNEQPRIFEVCSRECATELSGGYQW